MIDYTLYIIYIHMYFQLWLGNVWLIFQTLVCECIQGRCSWNADILRGGLLQCSWNAGSSREVLLECPWKADNIHFWNAPGMLRECCFSRKFQEHARGMLWECSGECSGNAPGILTLSGNAPGMLLESWLSPGMLRECTFGMLREWSWNIESLWKCFGNAPLEHPWKNLYIYIYIYLYLYLYYIYIYIYMFLFFLWWWFPFQ